MTPQPPVPKPHARARIAARAGAHPGRGLEPAHDPAPAGTPRYLGGTAASRPAASPAFLQREGGRTEHRAGVPVLRDPAREQAADRASERGGSLRGRASDVAGPSALGLGPGIALPPSERRYFEQRLGADLEGVRVHRDSAAATRLGARAFAAGRDIGFAPGQWRPGTSGGDRLLGHELAHVIQQGADGPAVQLQEDGKKEEEAADAIGEGLKTVVDKAKDHEGVKKHLLEPAKRFAAGKWDALGSGEKAGVIGFGAATYGLGLGAGLGSAEGRTLLSDVNLIAPLGLLPYATLTDFRYVLPESAGEPTLFKASFSGDDLLDLAHERIGWWPKMSLSLDFTWQVDAEGGGSLKAAKASWGVMPGLKLQAGSGVGLDWRPTAMGPDGSIVTSMKSVPEAPGYGKIPGGTGVFLSVDLLKLPIVPAPIREALGAPKQKR